jgi:hypothetical protein
VIFRLPPYYRNFGKRMVKSPKVYFSEPGLACWLLGIESAAEAARDPLHGNLFENLVVVVAFKARLNAGREPRRVTQPWVGGQLSPSPKGAKEITATLRYRDVMSPPWGGTCFSPLPRAAQFFHRCKNIQISIHPVGWL